MNYKILTKYIPFIRRSILRWLVRNNHHFIIALIYKIFAIKMMKNGNNSQVTVSDKITILAINADKFRGDPECLAQVSKFRVLTMDGKWARRLITAFTDKKPSLNKYMNAEVGDELYGLKEKIDLFFGGLLSSLSMFIKIDCIISHHYVYFADWPWVMNFAKRGIPYILIFREGLARSDRTYDGLTERHRNYKGYPVMHVVVNNKRCKETFVKSGFVDDDHTSAYGALRMDYLLKQIAAGNGGHISKCKDRRKRVTLFFFGYDMSLFGKEKLAEPETVFGNKYRYVENIWPHRMDLFRDLHIAIISLAQKLPEVDFVIKPKPEVLSKRNTSWDEVMRIVNEMDIDLNKLKNYTFEPNAHVHDLILNSDVVIALQSSTAIESAIAGKPVIFPLFYNYKETMNFNDFSWRNHLDLFDVAESANEMESLVIERLGDPEIDENIMESRRKLFKDCYSDLDGVALRKYSEKINNIVVSARKKVR
jgi:surface carbohydrate biosynthesis protein